MRRSARFTAFIISRIEWRWPEMRTAVRIVTVLLLALLMLSARGPGFRSRQAMLEHYAKHGKEFGDITPELYLKLAQDLRDEPRGGDIREAVRPDGVVTRFQRKTGYFGAYNADRT